MSPLTCLRLVIFKLLGHILLNCFVQRYKSGEQLGKLQIDVVLRWVHSVISVVIVPFLPIVLENGCLPCI